MCHGGDGRNVGVQDLPHPRVGDKCKVLRVVVSDRGIVHCQGDKEYMTPSPSPKLALPRALAARSS